MSKGSKPRPVDRKRWEENYDRIFGEPKYILKARKAMEIGYKIAPFNGRRRREDIVSPKPA
jgi:hypothetical protein